MEEHGEHSAAFMYFEEPRRDRLPGARPARSLSAAAAGSAGTRIHPYADMRTTALAGGSARCLGTGDPPALARSGPCHQGQARGGRERHQHLRRGIPRQHRPARRTVRRRFHAPADRERLQQRRHAAAGALARGARWLTVRPDAVATVLSAPRVNPRVKSPQVKGPRRSRARRSAAGRADQPPCPRLAAEDHRAGRQRASEGK